MLKNPRKKIHCNKFDKMLERKNKLEETFKGTGSFIYRNITKGTLQLPKPNEKGVKEVEPNKTWEGDSFYMTLVKNNFAALVKENTDKVEKQSIIIENKGEPMGEKLILDQPETITTQGKVEHVVTENPKLKEKNKQENEENLDSVLLTDDPLSGIQILG